MFFRLLGTVAGDVALTLGAFGGVYIGGGIVRRYAEAFRRSGFRERFEAKGRYQDYMRAIPTWVIAAADPTLTGLLAYARGAESAASARHRVLLLGFLDLLVELAFAAGGDVLDGVGAIERLLHGIQQGAILAQNRLAPPEPFRSPDLHLRNHRAVTRCSAELAEHG